MNLGGTAAWYELLWTGAMFGGALINAATLYQGVADRVAFRREVGPHAWRTDPLRIVIRQQIRTAALSLVAQLGGGVLGVLFALTGPGAHVFGRWPLGSVLTVYLMALAVILATKPLLNLLDNRRLYGVAARARVRAGEDAEARRQATVENLVGLLVVLCALAVAAYAGVLYNDLVVQDALGIAPLTPARYFGQLFRTLLTVAMTATLTGVVLGAVVGAFYRFRGHA